MKIKTSKGDRTFQVINILIFAIFAIICAYPFYYLIINSISANDLSASGKVNFLPHGFQLENYVKVFQLNGLGTAAMVSRNNCDRYNLYGTCFRLSGIHVYPAADVAQKTVVSFYGNYHVL